MRCWGRNLGLLLHTQYVLCSVLGAISSPLYTWASVGTRCELVLLRDGLLWPRTEFGVTFPPADGEGSFLGQRGSYGLVVPEGLSVACSSVMKEVGMVRAPREARAGSGGGRECSTCPSQDACPLPFIVRVEPPITTG